MIGNFKKVSKCMDRRQFLKGLTSLAVGTILGACNSGGSSSSSSNPVQNLTQEQRLRQLAETSNWVLEIGNFETSFNSIDYPFKYLVSIPVLNIDETSTTNSNYLVGVDLLENLNKLDEYNKRVDNFNKQENKIISDGELVNLLIGIGPDQEIKKSELEDKLKNYLTISDELKLFANGKNGTRRARGLDRVEMPGTIEDFKYSGNLWGNMSIWKNGVDTKERITQPTYFTNKDGVIILPEYNGKDTSNFFKVGSLDNGIYEVRMNKGGGKVVRIGELDKDKNCPGKGYQSDPNNPDSCGL